MSPGGFLEQLGSTLEKVLQATDYAPYGHVFKPYSAWVEAGAIYRSTDTAQNLSAIQDLIWYSINILAADEATLLSPRKMEFLCDLTFWGTFRSKEIWLDAVDIVTKHCDKFSVDGGTLQSMQKEALVVGESFSFVLPSVLLTPRTVERDV